MVTAKGRMEPPTPSVFQVVTRQGQLILSGPDETNTFAWIQAIRSVARPPPLLQQNLRVEPRSRFVLPVRVVAQEVRSFCASDMSPGSARS